MEKKHRFVYLYGFDNLRRIVEVKFLVDDAITVSEIKSLCRFMLIRRPDIVDVYAIDNSKALRDSFREVCKNQDFTKQIEFWDYVAKSGLPIYKRG